MNENRSLGGITFGRDVAVLLEELLTSKVAHSACFHGPSLSKECDQHVQSAPAAS